MGLCKDCFHREVCESWTTINLDDIPPEIPCGHFKDTADVAPRAEVAREIFEEIEEYAELQIESLNIVEKVDLSGAAFFGGGKQAFVLLLDRLAELKKKYTQSEPPKES